jgi:hypothetical protein
MKRLFAISTLAAMLAACETAPKTSVITIATIPPGAEVQIEGFGTCTTPCNIEVDQPRNITVAKAGFLAERFQIAPGQDDVALTLKLAAPTKDVDRTTLPDLQ